ncbi:hypothetical protein DFP73DRAFT_598358 [Morchella snyderi]|nr:hypothetical protein DFP73DRAFT_598358 [Morchella snyderi]
MATTPSETSTASPTQTTPITVTRAALVQNVTWNKQFRATIKAYKALLKGPDARTIPWRQVLKTEREKLLKLRWYYTIADAAYQYDRIDILDVLTFWDLYEEHYYAGKRWKQLRDLYNSNWDGNGNLIMDASTVKAELEDSGSSTDNDSDTDDDSELEGEPPADGEEVSEDVSESEAEPQNEEIPSAVHKARPRRRRGVARRGRPMTMIEE